MSRLQQQLKTLGFYSYSEITGYYGTLTKEAVIIFQKNKGLTADGIAGPSTLAALNGEAPQNTQPANRGNTVSLQTTGSLRRGDNGQAVRTLQSILKSKGFYNYNIDGDFGGLTERAIINFQRAAGLSPDGIVGPATLSKLDDPSITSRDGSTVNRGSLVEMLNWSTVDKLFPRKGKALVTDVNTGKSFYIFRMGGSYHADVEPLTSADTAIMKEVYGGSWSWNRRAVIVEVNGRRIAGSMNGMPHGQQLISGNNFDGQFCIHFLGSRVHKSGSVDADHQAMVKKAANSR